MSCTTLLVGKKATYDGSTFAARNEDSGGNGFTSKKFITVLPADQPRHYKSVLSHVEIDLPDDPMRYTCMPNATDEEGIWGAAGVNEENISMTATETLTSNERVLGADPMVRYIPASGSQNEDKAVPDSGRAEGTLGGAEVPGGIGEEDMVTLVLPYIHSAREGVLRLGELLTKYGTYEMNGIAFQDVDEIWWLETIGGHHWIAKRVPDDACVLMPNQLGIDSFDLKDAYGEQKNHLCSEDLIDFIRDNHLDISWPVEENSDVRSIIADIYEKSLSEDDSVFQDRDVNGIFHGVSQMINPRYLFGSHSDADHCYNTPRAWYMARYFQPHENWDGPRAFYRPDSDNLPWSIVPEKKVTVEDVKYILSSHYQGTPYDPYANHGDASLRGAFRPIGINRNNFLSLVQIRPYLAEEIRTVEWVAFGSNVFNAFVPFYTNIDKTPEYLAGTTGTVTTESFYWVNRIIGALADANFGVCIPLIERYQMAVGRQGYEILNRYDKLYMKAENRMKDVPGCDAGSEEPVASAGKLRIAAEDTEDAETAAFLEKANQEIADMLKKETQAVLDKVLYETSNRMKNAYSRADG